MCLVLAALLLSLPGVHAVQADDQAPSTSVRVTPAVSELPVGPSCGDGTDPSRSSAATIENLNGEIERIRSADPRATAAGDVVVLNGRGYNYQMAPSPDELERIRAAAESQAAATP
jgi:hypothetical protein